MHRAGAGLSLYNIFQLSLRVYSLPSSAVVAHVRREINDAAAARM